MITRDPGLLHCDTGGGNKAAPQAQAKADSPYKVFAKYDHPVKILRDGLVEAVSLDLVSAEPPGS